MNRCVLQPDHLRVSSPNWMATGSASLSAPPEVYHRRLDDAVKFSPAAPGRSLGSGSEGVNADPDAVRGSSAGTAGGVPPSCITSRGATGFGSGGAIHGINFEPPSIRR